MEPRVSYYYDALSEQKVLIPDLQNLLFVSHFDLRTGWAPPPTVYDLNFYALEAAHL